MALAAAGCGGSGKPLAIANGMSAKEVRVAAGRPSGIVSNRGGGACWFYKRTKTGKPIAVNVCFNNGRVANIDWSAKI
jgi:hypothetical protein